MQTTLVIVLLLASLLLFALVQACAHDAVFGDGGGGGLSKSVLVLAVPLFTMVAIGLLLVRQRAGLVSWPTRSMAMALTAMVLLQFAAVRIVLLAPMNTRFALAARIALAVGEVLLLVMAWRGPGR